MGKKFLFGAIDIGGTKIRMGLVDRFGSVLFRKMFLTPLKKNWTGIMDLTVDFFLEMVKEAKVPFKNILGVGIGCPGTFDVNRERISFAPNLNWRNVPIKEYIQKKMVVPVWFENDTNLSTMGVSAFGEGRKKETLIGIFIGTGIGGGLILNKKLFIGSTGGAGEIGHMIIKENGPKCHCGNRGCLESIASTRAIHNKINRTYTRLFKNTETLTDFRNNANKSQAIKRAYLSGEPNAVKIVDDAFHSLGLSMVSLINLLNPEIIVFGGGLAEALGEVITKEVIKTVKEKAMPGTYEKVTITCTSLGEDAPIVGAAALVYDKLNH